MTEMKRKFPNLVLSLLLLLSLTACGVEIQGADSAVIYGQYGASDSLIDLPVQEPESGSQSAPEGNQNLPDDNQAPPSADPNGNETEGNQPDGKSDEGNKTVDENGWYTSKEEVALYIHLYGELPDNYVTKREAEEAGWSGGSVERYTGRAPPSAAAPSVTGRACCPRNRGGPIPSATSTPRGRIPGAPNGSYFQTTAWSITPTTTMRALSCCTGSHKAEFFAKSPCAGADYLV